MRDCETEKGKRYWQSDDLRDKTNPGRATASECRDTKQTRRELAQNGGAKQLCWASGGVRWA